MSTVEPSEMVLRGLLLAACVVVAGLAVYHAAHPQKHVISETQATYCLRVASGTWPDYRHTYARECRATFGPAKPFVPYTER